MRFATRNAYYLRISATTVLPLYLYLDERHVDWMSERVLQHVLADLRPLIIPKLNVEADAQLGQGGPANAKRGSLDVHRGDTYQFGYFLRGTEPHAVLIKSRVFTAAPPRARPQPSESNTGGGKRSARSSSRASKNTAQTTTKAGKKRKPKPRPKGKGKARAVDDEDEAISISSEDDASATAPQDPPATRRSKRARRVVARGYREDEDEEMLDADAAPAGGGNDAAEDADDYVPMETEQSSHHAPDPIVPKLEETEPSLAGPHVHVIPDEGEDRDAELQPEPSAMEVEWVEDEEEPKPKPILKLRYHGFSIHGRCLCVIVEPYPPLRSGTRAPSLVPTGLVAPRAPSIAPPDFVPSGGAGQRERTPLFLPDFDREPTPAPSEMRTLPPVPLFADATEGSDEEDDGGMVLFSQILRSVGEHPPGIAEDDDEIDGSVLFGDADETREL
ncbi:hypothetical protein C8Q80DRAFT_1250317 [Daedaleopsis nitida]|nr:hypothetical protein C8Q80DRAFT_1250317 [Daedaleopsis nitida]